MWNIFSDENYLKKCFKNDSSINNGTNFFNNFGKTKYLRFVLDVELVIFKI